MFTIPDSVSLFFHPGSRIQGQKERNLIPETGFATKNLSILNKIVVPKLLEYDLECYLRIPDKDFFHPGSRFKLPGVKKHRIPDRDPHLWF
jgi:hypothetical protein